MIKKSYLFSIASSIIMILLFSACAAEDYPGSEDDEDIYFIDGPIAGGSWNDKASNCKTSSWTPGITSGKIPGTNLREKNAFNGKYTTIRLVFSAKN